MTKKAGVWMELDERKLKILKAIISNYLETGEPVGSRTISRYTDLNLSSAPRLSTLISKFFIKSGGCPFSGQPPNFYKSSTCNINCIYSPTGAIL